MLLFQLLGMHFLMDYPLQGDFIGKFKNRHIKRDFGIPWWHLMTAHAFMHGFGVVLLTESLMLGLVETVLHFIIDCVKCEGYSSIHSDQAAHVLCKITYWLALSYFGVHIP